MALEHRDGDHRDVDTHTNCSGERDMETEIESNCNTSSSPSASSSGLVLLPSSSHTDTELRTDPLVKLIQDWIETGRISNTSPTIIHDDTCAVCGDGGCLYLCDGLGCTLTFHRSCIDHLNIEHGSAIIPPSISTSCSELWFGPCCHAIAQKW